MVRGTGYKSIQIWIVVGIKGINLSQKLRSTTLTDPNIILTELSHNKDAVVL